MRIYSYVGPAEIAASLTDAAAGVPILNAADATRWIGAALQKPDADETITATFVVDLASVLRLADRRSEHIACAGGQPVLSAGEIAFSLRRGGLTVASVTNQSTGYCPQPKSWTAVAAALDAAGIARPHLAGFYPAFEFRRCPACAAINVVREGVYICGMCDAVLPRMWNFATAPSAWTPS